MKRTFTALASSEAVRFLTALFAALSSTVLLLLPLGAVSFDTDTEKYKDTLLPSILGQCRPEPWEFIAYAATVFLFPVLFFICYKLITLNCKSRNSRFLTIANRAVWLVGLAGIPALPVYILLATGFSVKANINPVYLISSVPVMVILFLLLTKYKNDRQKAMKVVFFAVMGVVLTYAFLRIAFLDLMMQYEKFNYHHYLAWWYPIYKVDSGQVIGTDFENIYGFYPYIAVPVLKMLGGVGQASSSVFVAFLLTVVSVGYYVFSYRFIENKILACIAATACTLYGPFASLGEHIYLQYHPTRSIFLSIMLILITVHYSSRKRSGRVIVSVLSCILSALGIFWNIESGAVAAVLWVAYIMYYTITQNGILSKKTLLALIGSAVHLIVSVLLFILAVELVTYSLSGGLLGKESILFGLTVFAGSGFYMLPMNYIGTWMLASLILLSGLSLSITAVIRKGNRKYNTTGLFVSSVMGIGAFSYFVGRSHEDTIQVVIPECVLVCAILAESLMRSSFITSMGQRIRAKEQTLSGADQVRLLVYGLSLLLCLSLLSYVFTAGLSNAVYGIAKNRNGSVSAETSYNDPYRNFEEPAVRIREWADSENNGRLPYLLTYFSVYYDELLSKPSDENVCEMIDWFRIENAETYLQFLKEHSGSAVVLSETAEKTLHSQFAEEFEKIMKGYRLCRTIRAEDEYEKFLHIYSPV